MREHRLQLGLAPHLQPHPVLLAELEDLLHHVPLLVHLDRVDGGVAALEAVLLDRAAELLRERLHARAEDVGEAQEERAGGSPAPPGPSPARRGRARARVSWSGARSRGPSRSPRSSRSPSPPRCRARSRRRSSSCVSIVSSISFASLARRRSGWRLAGSRAPGSPGGGAREKCTAGPGRERAGGRLKALRGREYLSAGPGAPPRRRPAHDPDRPRMTIYRHPDFSAAPLPRRPRRRAGSPRRRTGSSRRASSPPPTSPPT